MSPVFLFAAFLAIKLGPDETKQVRDAVEELRASLCAEQGADVPYSEASSPLGGDVYVSTQPYAAKGAWRIRRPGRSRSSVGAPAASGGGVCQVLVSPEGRDGLGRTGI